jgi:hypothetical protein
MLSKLSLLAAAVAGVKKEGISFVVVGDFTDIRKYERPSEVFDGIAQMKEEATPGSPEDFDFFITTGDNIYAMDAK